jgi:transcriptional regulator with XRE-family HTH domain
MKRRYSTLTDYLDRSGETQEQLAERLHISQPTISRAKQGLGSFAMLKAIADATGVPLDSFSRQVAA